MYSRYNLYENPLNLDSNLIRKEKNYEINNQLWLKYSKKYEFKKKNENGIPKFEDNFLDELFLKFLKIINNDEKKFNFQEMILIFEEYECNLFIDNYIIENNDYKYLLERLVLKDIILNENLQNILLKNFNEIIKEKSFSKLLIKIIIDLFLKNNQIILIENLNILFQNLIKNQKGDIIFQLLNIYNSKKNNDFLIFQNDFGIKKKFFSNFEFNKDNDFYLSQISELKKIIEQKDKIIENYKKKLKLNENNNNNNNEIEIINYFRSKSIPIIVNSSSTFGNYLPEKAISEYDGNNYFRTKDKPNQWFQIQFNQLIKIISYKMIFPFGWANCPSNFILEFSLNGIDWKEIDKQNHINFIGQEFKQKFNNLIECKYIKIKNIGFNTHGNNILTIPFIEFLGFINE